MYIEQLKTSVLAMIVLSALTGILYPFTVTGIARVLFPKQAGGSLVWVNDKAMGSVLIGQPFDDPSYFWSRPSATTPFPYNAANSSGSNVGPTNPALLKAIQDRMDVLHKADPMNRNPIPVDLVTTSASGLDPQISLAAAQYQIPRVARVRGIPESIVRELVRQNTQGRFLGLLGEPGVNVLKLNVALDHLQKEELSEQRQSSQS